LKKLLFRLVLPAAAIFMLVSAAQKSDKEYDWYFKAAGHERPVCFGGDTLPDEYGALYLGSPIEKTVYLTFDAGYDNGNVTRCAEILDQNGVTAAFFILPEMARSHAGLLKTLSARGNLICNHSSTHRNMAKVTDPEQFAQEIEECEKALKENTGLEMAKYFRPPEGSFSKQTLQFCADNGYTPVFWSFAYADWDISAQKDTDWAYEKIISNVHNGMVMLLHPTSATNAAILDRVIKKIKEMGYRFGTLDELNFYVKTGGALECISQTGTLCAPLRQNPERPGQIALTFDDGPHAEYTDEILDILAEYHAKATFFVTGVSVSEHPEQLRRIIAEGHELGNHTYSHLYLKNCSQREYMEDVDKLQTLLETKFGARPKVFRPPGGGYSEDIARMVGERGMNYVLWAWHTDARDWASPSVKSVCDAVLDTVAGGDVVLLHDYVAGKSPTPQALKIIIPELISRGYEFVTVSELFS